MTIKEIIDKHKKASHYIARREVGFAMDMLYELARQTHTDYYILQLDKHRETYSNILDHTFNHVKDPRRKEIYDHLLKFILELGDQLREDLLTQLKNSSIYRTKWSLQQQINSEAIQYQHLLEQLTVDQELNDLLKDSQIESHESAGSERQRSELHSLLFRIIWLTGKYGDQETKLVQNIIASDKLPWYDKALFTSALTLGVLHCFDVTKIQLLFALYEKKEDQIWERALVGLLFALYKYDGRIDLYPGIMKKLDSYTGDEELERNIEAIIIQTLRSKETEEITKKWEQEVLPEILKMRPEIEKKLDLENILSEKFLDDKNPDWEKVFEDSPDLLDKLQEFSQMQMEGSDVFMSAFGRLKHFPFFNRISNWFIPFYKENPDIDSSMSDDQNYGLTTLVEKLESSHFMCNSDKYSFCLNLQFIPEDQKNSMMQLFNEEMKQMDEMGQQEELLSDFARTKSIYTQYLQDVYRFFKLHPLKNEMEDIFTYKLDIYNTKFYNRIVENKKIRRNIAEFYFERGHYDQAIEVFSNLEEEAQNDAEVIEKIAYSYQRMGDYQKALNYYHMAELYDTNKGWVMKKIALCYRYLNNPEKALEYYFGAEKLEPDNLYIQAYIGHSLFQLERYEEALKYYFKVEYLAPENAKIRRPIAWCSFILGKYETAENYLHKLLGQENHYFDNITLGHVYWCMNDTRKAQEAYKNAALQENAGFDQFAEAFLDDRKYLENRGIDPLEINLMLDKVKFMLEE